MTSHRLRRRGPRSLHATVRRRRPNTSNSSFHQPQGGDLCESKSEPPLLVHSFTLLNHNVRGFLSNRAELEAHLETLQWPSFLALTETFLDASTSSPTLSGYDVVSRRDRGGGRHGGGVILFARRAVCRQIAHVGTSDEFERTWHVLHTDVGPICIGVWYRPPCYAELPSIESLVHEYRKYSEGCIGCMLVGDMNVHNVNWLMHSSHSSPEGKLLANVALSSGLAECVRQPTRGAYLLDLVLSDLASLLHVCFHPGVSDHSMVLCHLDASIPELIPATRTVYDYAKADWKAMSQDIAKSDWANLFEGQHVDSMLHSASQKVLCTLKSHTPIRQLTEHKIVHPWLNRSMKSSANVRALCVRHITPTCLASGKS